ncbi:AN1-type zinc finger protein 4 [Fasciola gigantica]|uniref:AN1-type zinc finger protein 4 n=1 Tax=Fasciola gigantica TaxID=46835 RepID=A0A504Y9V0_FASGI|nr:AN1-type zinc finger protein 4 [Fasciola gigantica]
MLMDLFIETLTGVSFELHVSPTETVMSIKSKIQRAEGIPVTQQHLIWKNDELDDHRRLHDYSISGGSTLRLVLGLRGGPLNAHRVPPLRLTPIHLGSSTTPMISKLSKIAIDHNRPTQLSRLTLPALSSHGVRSSNKQALRPVNPYKCKPNEVENCEISSNQSSPGQETVDLDRKTQTTEKHNPDLLASSLSKLTTSATSPLSTREKVEPSQNGEASHPRPVSRNSVPNAIPTTGVHEHESQCNSPRNINQSGSVDGTTSGVRKIESFVAADIAPEVSSKRIDSDQRVSVSASKYSPRFSKPYMSVNNIHSGLNTTGPNSLGSIEDRQTSNVEGTDRPSSPPLDYPPLINPSNRMRHPLNSLDLSSYWRLYEPSEVTALSQSSLPHSRFPLIGMTKPDNDSSSSSAPGSDCDSPTTGFNLIVQSDSAANPPDGLDDFAFTNSDVSSATATILAGLLSVTGDRLALPCQTSGSERGYGRGRYHWLRQRASPLLEATDELGHASSSEARHWSAGGTDDERDAIVPSTLYEFSAEEHEDENGEVDLEEDDDLDGGDDDDDEDEDDDGESVETKGAYACGPEDDDSLADLEDYLFFHRTADLLFGPPIASVYSPYSYPYADRDTFGAENWRNEFEADFAFSSSRERRKDSSSRSQTGSTWHQERTQLVEKVQDLKTRMREARVRRQSRRRRNDEGRENDATENPKNTESNKNDPLRTIPAMLPENPSDSIIGCSTSTGDFQSSNRTSPAIHSANSDSHLEQRPRQRRFGTVTPPGPSLIFHPNLSERQSKSSKQSTVKLTSPSPCSVALESHPNGEAGTLPCIRTYGMASLVAQDATLTSSDLSTPNLTPCKEGPALRTSLSSSAVSMLTKPPQALSPRSLPHSLRNGTPQHFQFLPNLVGSTPNPTSNTTRLLSAGESRARVCSRLNSSGGNSGVTKNPAVEIDGPRALRSMAAPPTPGKGDTPLTNPRSPPKPHSPNCVRRKRCALCLRKIGIVNSYSCRCGRYFCSRHRYAEVHACPFDYKAEARRTLIDSNPVVTAPKLPKI